MDYHLVKKKILEREFKQLNPMQQKAVFQVKGPVLILAGAGSGKTTVLINRIVNLIAYGNAYYETGEAPILSEEMVVAFKQAEQADLSTMNEEVRQTIRQCIAYEPVNPWQILAITFTNKAAGEIKERLESRLGSVAHDVWAGTFHWACGRILRRDIEHIGYDRNFTIYDMDDASRVVKDAMKDVQVNDKQFSPKSVLSSISRYKDQLISPEQAIETIGDNYRERVIAKIYKRYVERMRIANALDFDDMIVKTVELFEKYPHILDYYQNRFRYIMVDEYQDTNHAQYRLISLLAQKYQNICVVGDDDQSIYEFRGATIENILNFEHQFPSVNVIRLEQNYRSTQTILDAANHVIANNKNRKGKTLWTENVKGDRVGIIRSADEFSESTWIRQTIMDNVKNGMAFSDHAVLYRMNAQSNAVERDFSRSALPYRIIGGHRFYERKEIKDIMSYLAVINNPNDAVRLKRIIGVPKRGIGDATVSTAEEIAQGLNLSLFDVLSHADEYPLLSRKSAPLRTFSAQMLDLMIMAETLTIHELFHQVLEITAYRDYLKAQGDEGKTRLENIEELGTNILRYQQENDEATLSGFLEEVSLMTDIDNYDANADATVMMTVHAAKGLEFPVVFIVGMEEGIFPGTQASFDPVELEEERRLAYVAMTRAKQRLYMTTASARMLFGKTSYNPSSRFIDEIPKNFTDHLGDVKTKTVVEQVQPTIKPIDKQRLPFTPKVSADPIKVKMGDHVEHNVFGEGVVLSTKPMGNDTLLEIHFNTAGTKKIMANFAKLTKL